MRKAADVKKRLEEIKEEFEQSIFEELYEHIEETIDQAGSIGEIYANKKIYLDRSYLMRVIISNLKRVEELPEFSNSRFVEKDGSGNFNSEKVYDVLENALETINEKIKEYGWMVKKNENRIYGIFCIEED